MPQGRSRLLRSTLTGVFIVHYEMVEGAHTRLFALVHSGGDGSRKVTAKVDATGKGAKFVAMTVTTNGNAVSFASVKVQCIPILMIDCARFSPFRPLAIQVRSLLLLRFRRVRNALVEKRVTSVSL